MKVRAMLVDKDRNLNGLVTLIRLMRFGEKSLFEPLHDKDLKI